MHNLVGLLPGTDIYSDLERHRHIRAIDGVRIFRFDAPLMFINTELFRRRLYEECKYTYCPTCR
jgi:MFS superfamily sulfate permease-like transporter